jgi:glycosyltransferase involved in cell wall biosynthesis
MTYSIYDYSNTNTLHRKALLDAINSVNSMGIEHEEVVVVVSTRNMIKIIPEVIRNHTKTILAIVGFGRLYSDYGLLGRLAFALLVLFHDRTTAHAFVVEHDVDKAILQKFVRRPVFTTHGSGLDTTGFSRKRRQLRDRLQIGYLSRFGKSKGSHQILKAAADLPEDRHLIIAGWDIKGDRYSKEFSALAKRKKNVEFLGKLNSREEVSKFFNRLDLFLSPSVREGGNISLQEAIWHNVPFLTTPAPGCKRLAETFGCPMYPMEDFCHAIRQIKPDDFNNDQRGWQDLITPFLETSVRLEYEKILLEVIASISQPKV